MIYVFDTNSVSVLRNYYPGQFPSLWNGLDALVQRGDVLSVREVRNELGRRELSPTLDTWIAARAGMFPPPDADEMRFVAAIFGVAHFQALIGLQQRLKGLPVADPFVIASAKVRGGCVVTEEKLKPNAAKIPNVCEHFGVRWTSLEGFMHQQGWSF